MRRIKEREHLMKMFYEMDMRRDFSLDAYHKYIGCRIAKKQKLTGYYNGVYKRLTENLQDIDAMIDEYSVDWKISRMPKIDLAILRIALTEIRYFTGIPVSVSINEAVELAKKYSTENSSKFINGVLGNIVRDKGWDNNGAESNHYKKN